MAKENNDAVFQLTMKHFISGLINELSISIEFDNENLFAQLPNLKTENESLIEIRAKAKRNVFSTEIEIIDSDSILINNHRLTTIDDLVDLGFNDKQIKLLKENFYSTLSLENIYQQSQTQQPKILNLFEKILNKKFDYSDLKKPAELARLFSQLPQREAFILSDTCGNIDGSTGNPLKNVMFGEIDNAIEYHPIRVAFEHGSSQLDLVQFNPADIQLSGQIPDRLKEQFSFLQQGLIPLHPYSFKLIQKTNPSLSCQRHLNTMTLLSKRSLIDQIDDYQIKTSFPAQITSELRTIDWSLAHEILACSEIVEQLAQKQLLPNNYWVQLTRYAAQVKNDERTTFLIREGLQDAISNSSIRGIPKHLTPITACALTSRNILTPGKSLFESMIEFGFHGEQLFENITRTIIHTQLDLMKLGWLPDSHTQNVIYLFDFQQKIFVGLLQRDAECEKVHLDKLHSYGIQIPANHKISYKLLRNLEEGDRKLITLYLHHSIYTKHIIPIANILYEKYQINPIKLQEYVKQCLCEWKTNNKDYDISKDFDLSGRYYERNLACKTLHIGEPPHYRLIDNHPLLPQENL